MASYNIPKGKKKQPNYGASMLDKGTTKGSKTPMRYKEGTKGVKTAKKKTAASSTMDEKMKYKLNKAVRMPSGGGGAFSFKGGTKSMKSLYAGGAKKLIGKKKMYQDGTDYVKLADGTVMKKAKIKPTGQVNPKSGQPINPYPAGSKSYQAFNKLYGPGKISTDKRAELKSKAAMARNIAGTASTEKKVADRAAESRFQPLKLSKFVDKAGAANRARTAKLKAAAAKTAKEDAKPYQLNQIDVDPAAIAKAKMVKKKYGSRKIKMKKK